MSSAEVDRLFQPFTQADESTTRKRGGTGLGLAISYELAGIMGGTIKVVSERDHGSTFTLKVPLRLPDTAVVPEEPETQEDLTAQLSQRSILLVEDNQVNQVVAEKFLAKLGLQADLAENGEVAVEMFQQQACEIILMDMQMPVMSGLEATRSIRALGGKQPFIVGVTAGATKQDRQACLDAGMDMVITKPLSLASLRSAFTAYPGRQDAA